METPSARYIITRAIFLLGTVIAILYFTSIFKKKQRQAAIIVDLQSLTSDSSFFKQFYAEDAKKALVRAVALLAESNQLGVSPSTAIDRTFGIKSEFFGSDLKPEEPPPREKIIRNCLLGNYSNFLKLGYKPDTSTLVAMRNGSLPPIPVGPDSGKSAVVAGLIQNSVSPGMDKVIANLEIRPPDAADRLLSDIEIATAKLLATDLMDARIIEEPVCKRIVEELSKPQVKP